MRKLRYNSNKGWKSDTPFERHRHMLAAKYGRAGNVYKNGDPMLKPYFAKKKQEDIWIPIKVPDVKTDVKPEDPQVKQDEAQDAEEKVIGGAPSRTVAGQESISADEALIKRIQSGDIDAMLSKKEVLVKPAAFVEDYKVALTIANDNGLISDKQLKNAGWGELTRKAQFKQAEQAAEEKRIAHKPFRTARERATEYESTRDALSERQKLWDAQIKAAAPTTLIKGLQAEGEVLGEGLSGITKEGSLLPDVERYVDPETGRGPFNSLGASNPIFAGDKGLPNAVIGDKGTPVPMEVKGRLSFADKTVDDIWAAKDRIIKVDVDKPFQNGLKAFDKGDLPGLRNAITEVEKEKLNLIDRQMMVDIHTRPLITDNKHRQDLVASDSASSGKLFGSNPLMSGSGNASDKQMKQLDKLNTVLSGIKKEMNKTESKLGELRFKEQRLRAAAEVKPDPMPEKIMVKYDGKHDGNFFKNEELQDLFRNNIAFKKSNLGSDLKNAIDGSVLGGSSK